MNDTQTPVMYTANDVVVTPMTYKGVIVATTTIAAEYLGVNKDTLKARFSENKDNFKETEHYFYIEHKDLSENSQSPVTGLRGYTGNRGLRVFTQKGLLRLTRFLRSDRTDILFQDMEDSYFESKSKLPTTYIQSLQALIESEKEKEQALLERDIAIKTKAQIGDKKVATSMNTASQAVKKVKKLKIEVDELQIELDKSKDFSPVVTMTQNNPEHDFDGLTDNAIGRAMSKFCRDNEYFFKKINVEYTSFKVGTYPKEAWLARFGVER